VLSVSYWMRDAKCAIFLLLLIFIGEQKVEVLKTAIECLELRLDQIFIDNAENIEALK